MKAQIEALLRSATQTLLQSNAHAWPENLTVFIERPRDKSHGDFSANIAMLLAKPLRQSPRQIAEQLINLLPSDANIAKVEIAGAGFINFTLSEQSLCHALQAAFASEMMGVLPTAHPQSIVVDYSSPNLAKEMHVGHLRSTIIGDAIARVLSWKGHEVIRQNHVGDWGTQFGMLLAHLEDLGAEGQEVDLRDLESFYKASKKRFDDEAGFADRARSMVVKLQSGDSDCLALWQRFISISLSHCQEAYDRLAVLLRPDDVRAESAYNNELAQIVEVLAQKGLLREDEGAQCVFLPEFKGKEGEPLPIIVQKKDGGYLYATTDLAAIRYRQHSLHADRVLYVVDARQGLHFQQVFLLAHRAGFAADAMSLEHVGFGMVLDKQGRPFKSRDGGVTKLSDLLDEAEHRARTLIASKNPDMSEAEVAKMASVVGIAAVKYADLSKNRISDYVFDWDSMISFEGNTAPYLLYAYTRIQSVFLKAGPRDALRDAPFILIDEQERALAKHLLQFAEMIEQLEAKATPHLLCTYLFELAGLFSSFYEACPILAAEDESLRHSRLKLADLTGRILKQGLNLLGIHTLTRM